MADTQILTTNALTETRWPSTFFKYSMQDMFFSKFLTNKKEGNNNLIVVDKDLTKEAGDELIMRLIGPLTGSGQGDDGDIEKNEEALSIFNMPLKIHERGHGVRTKGKMTDQRSKINIRREGTIVLGEWFSGECLENDIVYALSGIANQGQYIGETPDSGIATVNEMAPSTNRILRVGQTYQGVLSTAVATDSLLGDGGSTDYQNYLFGRKIISLAKIKARMATPKIRPVKVGNKMYYIMLLHPWQVAALRNEQGDSTTGFMSWTAIQAQANVRGNENPLFQTLTNGAIGIYDDVILFEYDRILSRLSGEVFDAGDTIHSNIPDNTVAVCRSLLLGAQALCLGWGQLPKPYHKKFDYGRKDGVALDAIYAVKKTVFTTKDKDGTGTDQEDFACLCVDTCADVF